MTKAKDMQKATKIKKLTSFVQYDAPSLLLVIHHPDSKLAQQE